MGMATSLLRAGYPVQGYDVNPAATKKFSQASPGRASVGSTIQETVSGANIVLLMVQNAAQADDVLFGSGAGAASLEDGAVVILSSTVAPAFTKELQSKLSALCRGIALVDAPVSGGIARAANGTLTVRLYYILSLSSD